MNVVKITPRVAVAGCALLLRPIAFFFALALTLTPELAAKMRWDPLTPEDLAVPPTDAQHAYDVEVLISRVRIVDYPATVVQENYRRLKVFTAKGAEDARQVEIEFSSEKRIADLAARVVRPGGTAVELSEKDFQENTVLKFGRTKWKSKRAMLPDLAPGDVVEWRWKETWEGWARPFLFCQERFPVRDYRFTLEAHGSPMNIAWYQAPQAVRTVDNNELCLAIRDLPAFVAEPDMPPEFEYRSSVLLTYGQLKTDQAKGWKEASESLDSLGQSHCEPNAKIRAKATELLAGAATDEEKLRRLYEFCQTQIVNTNYDDSPASLADRKDSRDSWTAREVFKRGRGRSSEINHLFAALARAAGYQALLAASAERDTVRSVIIANGWSFVGLKSVAVKLGDKCRFFSPGDYWVQFGQLRWQEEGMEAVLGDRKTAALACTPMSEPEASRTLRQAKLSLDADGVLEGEVTETLTGHLAVVWRSANWNEAEADLAETVRKSVTAHLRNAEVTEVRVENLKTPREPLRLLYHLRVPDFAPIAGSRIVLVPNVFEAGKVARFSSETRRFPVAFPYAWQERDEVELQFPEGFGLDTADVPAPISEASGTIVHKVKIKVIKKRRVIQYERDFSLGAQGTTTFLAEMYPPLRRLFGALHAAATHSLVLKRAPAPSADSAASNPTAP